MGTLYGESCIDIAIAEDTHIGCIEVHWPSGTEAVYNSVAPN